MPVSPKAKPPKTSKLKQSDHIVLAIKQWIANGLKPGDRLPQEAELISQFGCARGTAREALRTLEVQGLIRMRSGPNGGATVAEIPPERACEMLLNYLHFEGLDGLQIYQLRKILEPELAGSVAGTLTPAAIEALEETIHVSDQPWDSPLQIERIRMAEIEFHNILARNCSNPLLRVWCLFINQLLADLVVYKKGHVASQEEFRHSNTDYHHRLLDALKRKDGHAAREAMLAHMIDGENYMVKLGGVVTQNFLGNPALSSAQPQTPPGAPVTR